MAVERPARFDITKLASMLEDVHTRLSSVTIENLHYEKFIQTYDREYTLFYLDPPYWNCENYYGKGLFNKDDFQTLANLLLSIKGKFIMSINDVDEICDLYKEFHFMPVQTSYSVARKKSTNANELLISNIKLTL